MRPTRTASAATAAPPKPPSSPSTSESHTTDKQEPVLTEDTAEEDTSSAALNTP